MDYFGYEIVVIGKYQIGKDCTERTELGRIELEGIKWEKDYTRLKIF